MFQKENAMIDRFTRGLTLFADQIHLKNLIRYLDDNITAEQFVCQLMNILYENDYGSDNGKNGLTPGYDLISYKKKEIIQISRTAENRKIKEAVKKLKRAIAGGKLAENPYTLRFVFLVNDASHLKNCAAAKETKNDPEFFFDPEVDILDFKHFAATVKTEFQFVPEKAERLRQFMDYCDDIFPPDSLPVAESIERVEKIISEYAHNFDDPLFMHQYSYPPVTLRQMYVDPAFYHNETLSRDMAGCIRQYIQDPAYQRERFLFIEGSAAIGKTSLVSWLCWHYQNQTATAKRILGDQKIVCIRLRELKFQGFRDADEVLLNYLGIPDVETFEACCQNDLLILDGADELSMVSDIPHGDVEEFLLALQRQFRFHKFLITTRPKFLDMEKFKSSVFRYRWIRFAHYNEKMRAEWVKRYLSCGQAIPENTERFIRELRGQEENGVADTPLALYLLAQCDAEFDLLGNRWALYRQIFSEAILRGVYNANFVKSGDLMDEHRSNVNYRVVQTIAFHIFRNAAEERYYLNESEVMAAIGECDLKNLSQERVRETCSLCAYWKESGSIGALEFYHNNIRDFFLCEYLCRRLLECLQAPGPEEALVPMLCRVLCYADICQSTWKQVYQYLCLRLDYESLHEPTADSLYHLLQKQKDTLRWILPRVTAGQELWNTGNDTFVYRGAKQTFRNIYMLVRILQSFCLEKIELTHTSLVDSNMHTMALLRDWNDIFLTPAITYVGHDHRMYTIDASSDTIYRSLDFSDRGIKDVDFRCCDMKSPDFKNTTMKQIWFHESVLKRVCVDKATIEGGGLSRTVIGGIRAHDVTLTAAFFRGTKLYDVDGSVSLRKCIIQPDVFLEDATLRNSYFEEIRIAGIHASRVVFTRTRFEKVWIQNSTFTKIDSYETTFSGTMRNAFFVDCLFDDCSFKCLNTFQDVKFRNCRFRLVSFRKMDLSTVTFESCEFEHCNIPQLQNP